MFKGKNVFGDSYKQLKRYLVSVKGMDSDEAKLCSNKYNRACRTYDKFSLIIKNISSFPKIDIHMAVNMEWVRRHNAIQLRMDQIHKDPTDIHSTIDWADVETSVQFLQTCAWYKKARTTPSEMAYILNSINCCAVQDAQQFSRR